VAGNVRLPDIVNPIPIPVRVILPSRPDIVRSLQTLGVPVIVTVNAAIPTFEFASKNTLSAAVGTEKPPNPPDESDQLVVLVLLHAAEPRIQ
jgi:hypothetical protein